MRSPEVELDYCNLMVWISQLFSAAADVLQRIGENPRIIHEFIELGEKAKVAASEAMDAEAVLGEIPDEFLDPIQVCSILSFFLFLFYQ